MNKNENDLWSNMNNPNNDANYDDWSNLHNPNNSNYTYHDDDIDDSDIYQPPTPVNRFISRPLVFDQFVEKNRIKVVELIKEVLLKESGEKGYLYVSQISSFLAHQKNPISIRHIKEVSWTSFIQKYSREFDTFYIDNMQSNIAVRLRDHDKESKDILKEILASIERRSNKN